MGTLYGILGTPLEDRSNHNLLTGICGRIARMHRQGQEIHRAFHYPDGALSEVPSWGLDGRTQVWSGQGWSMQMRSKVGENTVLGLEILLDPLAPCRTIQEAVHSRRPPWAQAGSSCSPSTAVPAKVQLP